MNPVDALRRFRNTCDRGLRAVELAAMLVAAACLLATMLLISADALLRYAINSPLSFQYTLTEDYLLVIIVTMAMAWGYRTGGYVRIRGVPNLLPKPAAALLIRAGLLASAGYVAVLGWRSWEHFLKLWQSGEINLASIQWPVWTSWIWVPVGLGLLFLRLVLLVVGPEAELDAAHEPETEM